MKKLILISLIFLFSCSTYTLTGIKGKSATYVVKAGEHQMEGGRMLFLKQKKYTFIVTTNSSWVWDVPEKNGFSKVTGIGFNNIEMIKQSARLVYINKANNVHEFWAYFYVGGINPQQDHTLKRKLIDVEIGKSYQGTVGYSNGWYTVSIGDASYSVKAQQDNLPFLLNPYVGGTYTLDHDWKVKIKYY